MTGQVKSGQAFEFGVAVAFVDLAQAQVQQDGRSLAAENYFHSCSPEEQSKIVRAAKVAVAFLCRHDSLLGQNSNRLYFQSLSAGQKGDVRDLIVRDSEEEVGISVKNRDHAYKNSRLSDKADFGKRWLGVPVSGDYWQRIYPIFADLRTRQQQRQKWRDVRDKWEIFYIPVLEAFRTELERIYDLGGKSIPKRLLHYLLGLHDYYRVVKTNGSVEISSLNCNGSLRWGNVLPMPGCFEQITRTKGTTLSIILDRGWEVSLRIHSADTMVEPSLKFDARVRQYPTELTTQTIDCS